MFSKPLLLATVQAVNIMHKAAIGDSDYYDFLPQDARTKEDESDSLYDKIDFRNDPDLRERESDDDRRIRYRKRTRESRRGDSADERRESRWVTREASDEEDSDLNKVTKRLTTKQAKDALQVLTAKQLQLTGKMVAKIGCDVSDM